MTTQTLRHSRFVQRSPIFYGWVVWFVGMIGIIATAPGQSFSVSLFFDHYIADFGLSRTSISGLYGLGTFTAALSLTWVGKRIDQYGNRIMSMVILTLFGMALLACSLINGPLAILLSFIAIRGLGQGSLGLVSSTAIAQWFQKRRGRVMGFALIGFALFQRFYLPAMQGYIDEHGWRAAWILCGGVVLVFMPISGLFLRDRPEDFGLEPDGETTSLTPGMDKVIEDNWTLREAMQTPIFWSFTFARMLSGAWGTGYIIHQISLFDELGHSAKVAAETYGLFALMAAGMMLLAGWLVDRLQPKILIMLQMVGLLTVGVIALIMTEAWMLYIYATAFGVAMGMGSVFDGTVWVNLYGRLNQGAIRGFVATALVAGTSIGPLVFGVSYDYLGSYNPAIWIGIALSALAMSLATIVQKPTREPVITPS